MKKYTDIKAPSQEKCEDEDIGCTNRDCGERTYSSREYYEIAKNRIFNEQSNN